MIVMTMLVSWIGVDQRGASSAYIMSESRFSWGLNGKILSRFDYGRKVFASRLYPEIMGYSGDVLFPTVVLSQIIEMIDMGLLFDEETSCEEKSNCVFNILCDELAYYPTNQIGGSTIEILHISRDTGKICARDEYHYLGFYAYKYIWHRESGWTKENITIPSHSGVLSVMGSGKKAFEENYVMRYNTEKSNNSNTSRNIYHCFIDTLNAVTNGTCGGAPQLVGIYRKPGTAAENFGLVYNNKRYILGVELGEDVDYNSIEWRNELFELTDGNTKKILFGAIRQPDILRRH